MGLSHSATEGAANGTHTSFENFQTRRDRDFYVCGRSGDVWRGAHIRPRACRGNARLYILNVAQDLFIRVLDRCVDHDAIAEALTEAGDAEGGPRIDELRRHHDIDFLPKPIRRRSRRAQSGRDAKQNKQQAGDAAKRRSIHTYR